MVECDLFGLGTNMLTGMSGCNIGLRAQGSGLEFKCA